MSIQEIELVRIQHQIVFIGLLFVLAGVVYACLPRTSKSHRIVLSPTPTPQRTVSPSEMQLRAEATRRALNRDAKWSGLGNLEELSLTPLSSETRIWVGFDGAETPCFVVRSDGTRKSAALISAKFMRTNGKWTVSPVRTELSAPQSGWISFETYLKDQGVTNPLKFSLDDIHLVDPDEGSIVIETKSDSEYSMVFFPLGTETEDGKRALQICRKVEQEFGISMRCSEGRS